MRWSVVIQNFTYALCQLPGDEMSIHDAMSRSRCALTAPEFEAVEWSDFTSSSSRPAAPSVLRVVDEVSKIRVIFDGCHNSTQGYHHLF